MNYGTAGLRYILLKGNVLLDDLHILNTRRLEWLGQIVTIRALGASHAICLDFDDNLLTEVLSCAPSNIKGQILFEACGANPFEFKYELDGLVYRFRLGLQALCEDHVLPDGIVESFQMTAAYPRLDSPMTPITRIKWQIEPNVLRVKTVHTYPEEKRIVISESSFETVLL